MAARVPKVPELDVPKRKPTRRARRAAKPVDGSFYERRDLRPKG
jgi:hypothetical protein